MIFLTVGTHIKWILLGPLGFSVASPPHCAMPLCEEPSFWRRSGGTSMYWVAVVFVNIPIRHSTPSAWASKEKWNTGDISDGVAYKVPNNTYIDIDTLEDWEKAELLYKISLNSNKI